MAMGETRRKFDQDGGISGDARSRFTAPHDLVA